MAQKLRLLLNNMDKEFTEYELDAIKEVCNIASANAASALSMIVNKKINMKVPEIQIVPIEDVVNIMGTPTSIFAGIYSKLIGDLGGGVLLTFPRNDVIDLADKLLGSHSNKMVSLSELNSSAICEIGNIIIASFVASISKMINKTLFISVPKLAFDMLGSIVDFILIELAENAEHALVMKIEFEDEPRTISGHFFILPDPGSLEMFFHGINEMNNY